MERIHGFGPLFRAKGSDGPSDTFKDDRPGPLGPLQSTGIRLESEVFRLV